MNSLSFYFTVYISIPPAWEGNLINLTNTGVLRVMNCPASLYSYWHSTFKVLTIF